MLVEFSLNPHIVLEAVLFKELWHYRVPLNGLEVDVASGLWREVADRNRSESKRREL